MQTPSEFSTDEVFSFVGLSRLLMRRRWWLAIGFVAVLIVSVLYLVSTAPVYEARVRVRIGQVGGTGPFEAADVLASRLLASYGAQVADGVVRPRPHLVRATPLRNVPGLLDLEVHADLPDEAVQLLARIRTDVTNRHNAIYERNVEELERSFASLDQQQATLQRQHDEIEGLLRRVGDSDAVQASLLAIERSRISEAISKLATEKPGLVLRLAPPSTQPTELLGEIVAPESPFTPRTDLVLALALVLGSIFGIVLALFGELLWRIRRTSSRQASL